MLLAGVGVAALVAAVALGTQYDPIGAEAWEPPSPLPVLEWNRILTNHGEQLFAGRVLGPESLAVEASSGLVYTGLMSGEIVRFDPLQASPTVESFLWLNASCAAATRGMATYASFDMSLEPLCGRPLGMRFDAAGRLLVNEAYSGILEIDTQTKRVRRLTDGDKLVNDLDVDGDDVYFSVSSPRWGRNRIILELLSARRTGVLKHLDRSTGIVRTVVQDVPLTNGVVLSHDRRRVLFVAGPAVHAYNRAEDAYEGVALDNLPCIADNIRRHPSDGRTYLLACGTRRAQPFSLTDFLAPYPWAREAITLLVLYSQHTILSLIPTHSMVLRVDVEADEPEIVSSIQDPTDWTGYLSEAEKIGPYLYMGTWRESHLTRMLWNETGF